MLLESNKAVRRLGWVTVWSAGTANRAVLCTGFSVAVEGTRRAGRLLDKSQEIRWVRKVMMGADPICGPS